MKHRVVLSIYMYVEGGTEEEAFDKAEETTEGLFEKSVYLLDSLDGFEVEDWFCEFAEG